MRGEHALRVVATLAIVAAVLALQGYRLWAAPFDYVLWSDRDLFRSARLLVDWPTTGAELSFMEDARVPGGFLHVLWAIPLALSSDPANVYRFGVLLDVVALCLVARAVSHRVGAWAGAVAAAFQVAAPANTETMLRLWNPSFVPVFCAAQVALVLRIAEGAGLLAWVGLGLVTSLGAQLHLGLLLFGGGLVVGLWLEPVSLKVRGTLAALAGAVVGYAPYLLVEAWQHWPNTRALLAERPPDAPSVRDALAVLAGFAHQLSIGSAYSAPHLGWANLLHVGGLVAVVLTLRHLRSRDRAGWTGVIALIVGILVVPAFHLEEARVDLSAGWDGRYMVPCAIALAAVIGLGWGGLVGLLRTRALSAGVVVVVTAAAVAGPLGALAILPRPGIESWAFQQEAIAAVRADTGWSLEEVAGRTSLWRNAEGQPWQFRADQGIDYPLMLAGGRFPGSLPPPCAIVLQFGANAYDDVVDVETLQASLGQDLGGLSIVRQSVFGPHRLVIVDVGGGHCPTTLSDRYVLLQPEQVVHDHWRELASGTAIEVAPVLDGRRFVGRFVPPQGGLGLGFALDLVPTAGHVAVTLHANQLRGHAHNPGLLSVAMIGHPRVVLEREGASFAIPLAADLAGNRGVLTPLSAEAAIPAGSWRVSFVAEWIPVTSLGWPLPTLQREPFAVPIGELDVPPDR